MSHISVALWILLLAFSARSSQQTNATLTKSGSWVEHLQAISGSSNASVHEEMAYIDILDHIVGGDRGARTSRLAVALLWDKASTNDGRSKETCCCLR